jgi:hypothetical protein
MIAGQAPMIASAAADRDQLTRELSSQRWRARDYQGLFVAARSPT